MSWHGLDSCSITNNYRVHFLCLIVVFPAQIHGDAIYRPSLDSQEPKRVSVFETRHIHVRFEYVVISSSDFSIREQRIPFPTPAERGEVCAGCVEGTGTRNWTYGQIPV